MSSHTPTSPVPAYEAHLPQLSEKSSPSPAMQDVTVYGAATGQQHSGNTYSQQPVSLLASPLASPVQQQQGMPPGKQEYFTTEQQPQQQQQLYQQQQQHPQQQQQQQYPQQQQQLYSQQQPQQQQLYPQQQPPQQQQQQAYQTAIPLANLTEFSAPVDCPVCRHRALTAVEPHAGNTTHAWAAIICLVFLLGCIPYLMNGLKDVRHKCGHCGVVLAEWHKSGRTVVFQHA